MRKVCEPAVLGMAVPQCSFTSLLCVEFGFLHQPGAVWGHSLKVQSCDSACLGKVCAVPNTCAGCGPVKSTLRGAVADISHWATGKKDRFPCHSAPTCSRHGVVSERSTVQLVCLCVMWQNELGVCSSTSNTHCWAPGAGSVPGTAGSRRRGHPAGPHQGPGSCLQLQHLQPLALANANVALEMLRVFFFFPPLKKSICSHY